jgi:hypothetical protein
MILVFQIYFIQLTEAVPGELKTSALSNQLTASLGSNTSLACSATTKPILCLWKTPYGHVYTLSEGVFAESGRLRHEVPPGVGGQGCGIQIVGVETKDQVKYNNLIMLYQILFRLIIFTGCFFLKY